MLRPAKVLIIDSRPFNGASVKQHPERFDEYDSSPSPLHPPQPKERENPR